MDKYDQAIEFLKGVDPGSYFDECAELMEELLALTHKPEKQKPSVADLARQRRKQMDAGARYYAKVRGLL
jgi:hypothetical protein